ncbi:MAG: hypothetical protein AAGK22_28500, partial [Acidobacteriota bacterium]
MISFTENTTRVLPSGDAVEAVSPLFKAKARWTPAAGKSGRLSLRLKAGEVFNSAPAVFATSSIEVHALSEKVKA